MLKVKKAEAFSIIFTLIISIFAIAFLLATPAPLVSAETTTSTTTCCEKTNTGEWCQNTLAGNCDSAFLSTPTSCDATSFCKTGCCYSSFTGECDKNSPKKLCEQRNGTFNSDASCNIPQCSLGCCVLFNQASLETLVRCKRVSAELGYNTDWRADITDEILCAQTYQLKDEGACVHEKDFETTCEFTTREECLKINSNPDDFHKDYLCSAEILSTNCGPSDKTTCVEGKDAVYYEDTCGNPANIYDSNKRNDPDYWNKVVTKEQACGSDGNSANSALCGNCDYFSGSVCKAYQRGKDATAPKYGNNLCRDLNCYDTYNGNDYLHGEAWCVYDEQLKNGTALAGSRQWRHLCIEGEEKLEPCGDYRQEVCVQEVVDNEGQDFSFSKCRLNNWRQCLGLESNECAKYPEDCFWMGSAVYSAKTEEKKGGWFDAILSPFTGLLGSGSKSYAESKGACMPIYPAGFKPGENNDICATANSRCDVLYEKGLIGSWKCVQNCECLTQEWVNERNAVCNALGDCGGKKNIVGVYTDDGYGVSGPGINKKSVSSGVQASQTTTAVKTNVSNRDYSATTGNVISGMAITGFVVSINSLQKTVADAKLKVTTAEAKVAEANTKVTEANAGTDEAKKTEAQTALTNAETALATAKTDLTKAETAFTSANLDYNTFSRELAASKYSQEEKNKLDAQAKSGDVNNLVKITAEVLANKPINEILTNVGLGGTGAAKKTFFDPLFNPASKLSIIAMPLIWSFAVSFLTSSMGAGTSNALTAATFYGTLTYKILMQKATTQAAQSSAAMWGIGVGLVIFVLTYKEQKVKTVTFTCNQWQAPVGGKDCEKCNKDSMKPCSEYRCSSLGQNCKILNPGNIGNETCVNINPNDAKAPLITPWQNVLTNGFNYINVKPCPPGPGCWKVNYDKDTLGCAIPSSQLTFGISTDEPSQCKYDYNRTSFDNMQFTFDNGLYIYNHSLTFRKPGPTNVNDSDADSIEFSKDGNYNLYVVCRDGSGNKNEGQLAINFCVQKGPDMTPPLVVRTSIENNAGVSFGSKSAIVGVYLNEPADCKWSKIEQDYKDMNNSMACVGTLEQKEADDTYLCLGNLTNIQDKVDNVFYFKCKDQPWLTDDSKRNTMPQGYKFTLKGTIPLNISKVEPNGTISGGSEPITVNLKVETINGYDNGKAKCYYSPTSTSSGLVEFFNTNKAEHEQTLNLDAGVYKYYILCRDLAGNVDTNSTEFSVQIDNKAPVVVRAYRETSTMKIATDEESSCVYDIKSCNYEFNAGTAMTGEFVKEHSADWRTDVTYYIKCKDSFGNMPAPASCSLVAHGYEIQQAS